MTEDVIKLLELIYRGGKCDINILTQHGNFTNERFLTAMNYVCESVNDLAIYEIGEANTLQITDKGKDVFTDHIKGVEIKGLNNLDRATINEVLKRIGGFASDFSLDTHVSNHIFYYNWVLKGETIKKVRDFLIEEDFAEPGPNSIIALKLYGHKGRELYKWKTIEKYWEKEQKEKTPVIHRDNLMVLVFISSIVRDVDFRERVYYSRLVEIGKTNGEIRAIMQELEDEGYIEFTHFTAIEFWVTLKIKGRRIVDGDGESYLHHKNSTTNIFNADFKPDNRQYLSGGGDMNIESIIQSGEGNIAAIGDGNEQKTNEPIAASPKSLADKIKDFFTPLNTIIAIAIPLLGFFGIKECKDIKNKPTPPTSQQSTKVDTPSNHH